LWRHLVSLYVYHTHTLIWTKSEQSPNLPRALQMSQCGLSSKSLAITANGLRCRCIMNTHNVRGNRRANGVQYEHHACIMMEQKEHTREAYARKCRACVANTRTTHNRKTHIHVPNDNDVPMLRCYYLASPHRSTKILIVLHAGS